MTHPLARSLALAAIALAGCQDNVDMVTAALDSVSATEATTAASTGTTDGTASTGGSGTAGTAAASTAGSESEGTATGGPVPCEAGVDCTAPGDPDGEVGPLDLPYFRGHACAATTGKSGEKIAVRLEACVHPCLKTNAFAFRHAYRCEGSDCEAFVALYYTGVTGSGCPADVFGKFDPALCKWLPAIDVAVGPVSPGGTPHEGQVALHIPFLTNDDATTIAGGIDSAAIWPLIEAHPQDPERTFTVDLAAANASGPATCTDGGVCTCKDVAL